MATIEKWFRKTILKQRRFLVFCEHETLEVIGTLEPPPFVGETWRTETWYFDAKNTRLIGLPR